MKVPKSQWSKTVREMDGNKCAFCGSTERVEAHHIIPQFVSEELSTELENGISLCKKCHYTAHAGKYNEVVDLGPLGDRPIWGPHFTADPRIIRDFIKTYQEETEILYCELPRATAKAFQAACRMENTTPNAVFQAAAEAFMAEYGGDQGQEEDENT